MLTAKYWGNAINSIYYMQLFIIIATPFLYKALSREKKPFIKALFFTFSTPPPAPPPPSKKKTTTHNGTTKIVHFTRRESL